MTLNCRWGNHPEEPSFAAAKNSDEYEAHTTTQTYINKFSVKAEEFGRLSKELHNRRFRVHRRLIFRDYGSTDTNSDDNFRTEFESIRMGNKIARTTQVSASEYYLHDLPSSYNLVLKEVLGRGRSFKSILCKHDEGLVLVKVYFKRGDSIDLKEYERRLSQIKEIFLALPHPHVWPFQVSSIPTC